MKKKNIAISFLLLLVAAGIWYYVSLPAFNIHSSGVWYFVLVLVLAVGLVFAGKKGLRYGAIDLKEMKESKGFKWCVRLFIFLLGRNHSFFTDCECEEIPTASEGRRGRIHKRYRGAFL